jgi:preprotein translocase subunit SecF
LAKVRETVSGLGYADVQVQNFGTPRDVMIRLPVQKGVTSAQQSEQVLGALKASDPEVTLRRTEFVGPQVGEELVHGGPHGAGHGGAGHRDLPGLPL